MSEEKNLGWLVALFTTLGTAMGAILPGLWRTITNQRQDYAKAEAIELENHRKIDAAYRDVIETQRVFQEKMTFKISYLESRLLLNETLMRNFTRLLEKIGLKEDQQNAFETLASEHELKVEKIHTEWLTRKT